jgi:hypothetical protein
MKSKFFKSIFALVIVTLLAAACSTGRPSQPTDVQANANQPATQEVGNQNNANEQVNENANLNTNENSNENTNSNNNSNQNANANDNGSVGAEIEIEGVVESVQDNQVVVNGEEIDIQDFPEAAPLLLTGVEVKIKAVVQADSSLRAVRIEIGDMRWESDAGLQNTNSNSNANTNTNSNSNDNEAKNENDNNSNG